MRLCIVRVAYPMSQRWIKKTNYIKRHGKRRARSVELPCAKHIKITPWQFHSKEFGNTKGDYDNVQLH